jgi:DNA-binding HxlR family transcriptional regulator
MQKVFHKVFLSIKSLPSAESGHQKALFCNCVREGDLVVGKGMTSLVTEPGRDATRANGRRYDGLECPIYWAIELLAHKWATAALVCLSSAAAPLRFQELRRQMQRHASVPLSAKELALRLRELEAAGVVTRTEYDERVPRVEYELTARGQSLMPILFDLLAWAEIEGPQPA